MNDWKKYLLLTSMFVTFYTTSPVFSEEKAQNSFEISFGSGLHYSFASYLELSDTSPTTDRYQHYLALAAYADFTWAVINIFFERSIFGPQLVKKDDNGYIREAVSEQDTSNVESERFGNINIQLLGKYPLRFENYSIFPLLGFEWVQNYDLTYNNEDIRSKMSSEQLFDLNGLIILAGAGADFDIDSQLYFRPVVLAGWDFLSTPYNASSSITYVNWKWMIDFYLGMRL